MKVIENLVHLTKFTTVGKNSSCLMATNHTANRYF